ncbi:TadE/TadG family type IV pilus assembly protein [Brevundimonas staleyi]|uniref:TadE/TadG family type IV pilus assembly protein n=1 Tax=Brevundimonas staleyi TaxID=74326 RepID=A0ABW0FV99_9CAUL
MEMFARRHLKARRQGSAAVEFALVGPLMVVMLMGMVVYGGWMWLAQSVQTLATESARAAIGGLDAAERISIAQAFVDAEAQRGAGLTRDHLTVLVESDAQAIRVRIAFDARDHPVMAMAGLLPAPPSTIERTAVVRTGGY